MSHLTFKNIIIYRLSRDVDLSPETIETHLAPFALAPCGSQDMAKAGWVSPMGKKGTSLFHAVNGQVILCARKEEKILPASVIKEEVQKQIEKLEGEQHRKLKKTERDSLKDEALQSLLPRAFSRFSSVFMWIDTVNDLIVVDSTSSKRAEDVLALLRKSLGSLPVVPLTMESPIELTLTEWVRSGQPPAGFVLQDEAQLKAILEEGGTISCKKQDLCGDEVATNIEAGKLVTTLALEWQERISFSITDSGSVRKLKFCEHLLEQNDDIDREDFATRFDADAVLLTGELSALINDLIKVLGGEMERGAGNPNNDWVDISGTEHPHDDLYPDAVSFVRETDRASISGLQRKFRIGYNRAAWLIERMQVDGIVSTPAPDGTRSVLTSLKVRGDA